MRNYWAVFKQNALTIGAYVRVLVHRINGRIVWLFGSSAVVAIVLALPIAASRDTSPQAKGVDSQTIPLKTPTIVSPPATVQDTKVDRVESSSQSQPASNNRQSSAQTKLRVNGQSIQLLENGTVHKQIISTDGTTNLDVSIESTSSGDDSTNTYSSSSINVQTTTESSTDGSTEVSGP